MDNTIQQLIKQRYHELPEDVQRAIKSTDLAGKFTTISNKHSLLIDQSGSLQTETILVMLGLELADDYVGNLQRELEISRGEAQSLAEDVNKEILGSIRDSLRKMQQTEEEMEEKEGVKEAPKPIHVIPPPPVNLPQSPNTLNLSPLEKVGGFTLEKRPASNSPQYNDSNLKREAVLNDLENIEKLKPATAPAFVDHLLSNPVSNVQEKEEKKVPATKPMTTDPYREPAE